MKLHANAALGLRGRRQLCWRVLEGERTLTEAAEAAGVSVRCARKWVGRYRVEGELGLVDNELSPRRRSSVVTTRTGWRSHSCLRHEYTMRGEPAGVRTALPLGVCDRC